MDKKNLKELIGYIAKYKLVLLVVFIALFTVSGAILAIGSAFRGLVDEGLSKGDPFSINYSILYIIILIIIFSIGSFCRSFFINLIALKVSNKISLDAYKNLLQFDYVKFESLKLGDVVSRLGNDIDLIKGMIVNVLSFLVRNAVMLFGALILMFIQSPKLSIIVIIGLPIILLPLLKLSKKVRSLSGETLSEHSKIMSSVEENFLGIQTLYAYNKQNYVAQEFSHKLDHYNNLSSRRLRLRSAFFAFVISLVTIFITMVIWLGSIDIIAGKLSSGQMLSFIYYAMMVGLSAGGIAEIFSEIQSPLAALFRVFEIKNMQNQSQIVRVTNVGDNFKEGVEFKNVSFFYPSRPDIQVLDDISFTLKANSYTGIAGKSGSGKSTLMQLLLKFYSINVGQILIENNPIDDYTDYQVREKISYVPQQPFIFSGSIKSNILFARPDAAEEELQKVLEITGVDIFSANYKNGLDTEIGERGVRISGGQKQRIAIARALIYNPEILLLDEATSAIDEQSEKVMLNKIRAYMKGKSVVSIAHRVSSLEYADEIILISNGKVSGVGSHSELMRNSSIYSSLYNQK